MNSHDVLTAGTIDGYAVPPLFLARLRASSTSANMNRYAVTLRGANAVRESMCTFSDAVLLKLLAGRPGYSP